MNKIFLIIQREFSSRVKKKSFLLTTLLVPILFPSIIGLIVYFSQNERDKAAAETIYVLDESGNFNFNNEEGVTKYVEIEGTLESARTAFLESDAYALLYIPEYDFESPEGFEFFTQSSAKDPVVSAVENRLESMVKNQRLANYQIDEATLKKLNVNVSLSPLNISEGEGTRSNAKINIAIGYLTGFLIYMFMFAYGGQVMQGVIEEKSNKIVEIIISTVRPFQLMLGKILGIALVGLTQVTIWIVLMWAVWTGVMFFLGPDSMPDAGGMNSAQIAEAASSQSNEILQVIESIPFVKIILLFIFYFLGGYLLYGALFAAVGSAVDSPSEAQQFMLPIMLPLIVGFVGMSTILDNPDSSLGFWLSMIPFTSPIAMMGRIGYDVPLWQLLLSMALLIAGFIGTTWLAGRIYRIGILMHGTKVNYKVLAKWLTMK